MPVNFRALRMFCNAWQNNIMNIRRMGQVTDVKPLDPQRVFTATESETDGTLRIDCGPAAFMLSEKPNSTSTIYVGVKGWISVNETGQEDVPFYTMDFGTKVAYFRSNKDGVAHIYGVHYDMDTTGAGHPVFHSQFQPMTELFEIVRDQLGICGEPEDCVGRVLRNVRTPTAQMDFFSVFTQLCADHLMRAKHEKGDVTGAFKRIRTACDFMRGAAYKRTKLNSELAATCYRSVHWYK